MFKLLATVYTTLVYLNLFSTLTLSCKPKDFGNGGTVCVCDESYCDFIGPIVNPGPGKYLVYTSNLAGQRFNKTEGSFVENILNDIDHWKYLSNVTKKTLYKRWEKLMALKRDGDEVYLNEKETHQEIFGFGGAFTDATGINIDSLPEKLQGYVLRSYFSEDGIEYNIGRVPIGGTDFSTYAYSYDDGPEDQDLVNFALNDFDYKYKIPLIRIAKNMNGNLKLFASAWTAPKWMKTNNKYVGGYLKPNMYQTWADYHLKFLEEYEKNGVDFWGLTTGNEPSLALFPAVLVRINSVGWTSNQMGKWISQNLGPTVRNSKYKDLKIMGLDDQRLFLIGLYKMLSDPTNATNYIDGIAVHWYLDKYIPPITLKLTHFLYPEKFILSTEACEGSNMLKRGVRLGDWERAEDYASDIIEDLNNWVTGWVDWNMALDMSGGPTYINNAVDSPIIVDADNKLFYKNPMFYAMGHFSKFLTRGSLRLGLGLSRHFRLEMVAVRRPDGGVAIVILNKYNMDIPLTVSRPGNSSIILNITPKSITTVLYW